MSKRENIDNYFLKIAELVGTRSTCNRGKTGCIIVKDKRIISTGYAGSPSGLDHCDNVGHFIGIEVKNEIKSEHCFRGCHAEENAILQCSKFGVSTNDSILYCTMTPCFRCAKMIINSGIRKIICLNDYHDSIMTKKIFKESKLELKILNDVKKY